MIYVVTLSPLHAFLAVVNNSEAACAVVFFPCGSYGMNFKSQPRNGIAFGGVTFTPPFSPVALQFFSFFSFYAVWSHLRWYTILAVRQDSRYRKGSMQPLENYGRTLSSMLEDSRSTLRTLIYNWKEDRKTVRRRTAFFANALSIFYAHYASLQTINWDVEERDLFRVTLDDNYGCLFSVLETRSPLESSAYKACRAHTYIFLICHYHAGPWPLTRIVTIIFVIHRGACACDLRQRRDELRRPTFAGNLRRI